MADDLRDRLLRPQPCNDQGDWWEGGFRRPAWTPKGFLRRGRRYILTCACGYSADAPLQALVDAGKGDLPMATFSGKWKCAACDSRAITVSLG